MDDHARRIFWNALLTFIGLELLSWFVWPETGWMNAAWGVVVIGAAWLGWRRPVWLVWAGLGELVIGGKGYLLSVTLGETHISLRMGLFVLTALVALVQFRRQQAPGMWFLAPVAALLAWIGIMSVVGLAKNFGLLAVWLDANGFLYLFMALFWWVLLRRRTDWLSGTLAVILAGVTLVGLKTWLMTILFAHQPDMIRQVYLWIRQTGIGEVTLVQEPVHRVFFQSHLYAAIGFILTLGGLLWRRAPRWWMWPMLAGALGLYLSLSRSLWLGTLVALVALLVFFLRQLGWRSLPRWLMVLPVIGFVGIMTSWAYHWPQIFPNIGEPGINVVRERFTAAAASQAANARLNQLQPLRQAIQQQPLLGHGFGKTVTYYSTDPRVRGWRTTSAFELGYLDIWLKTGLIGLILLGWVLLRLSRRLKRTPLAAILGSTLIVIIVTHATTPYVNHPLGLGWLAFLLCYAGQETT